VELHRPDRARRRRKGKTDPVDAEAAARAVLAGDARAIGKDRNGAVGQLRAWWWLAAAQRPAPRPPTSSARCWSMATTSSAATAAAAQGPPGPRVRPAWSATGLQLALASLGRRWLALDQQITSLDAAITTTVRRTAAKLLERHSVGGQTAAQLLITAGEDPDRLHSEAALAAMCGASPVQASSGKRIRHRLNRGGDRAANSALWTIANNRLMHGPRSRAAAARRTTMGNSRKQILRCVKQALARELYPLILDALALQRLP
jgi:transposase